MQVHIHVLACWGFGFRSLCRWTYAIFRFAYLLWVWWNWGTCFLHGLCRDLHPSALPCVLAQLRWSGGAVVEKPPCSCRENRANGNGRRDGNRWNTSCHFAKWLFTRALLWIHSDAVQMILGLLNNSFLYIYCSWVVPDSFIARRLAHYEKKSK